ncbi:MAG: endonuclease V [Candidatus Eisenbacteria bacterium]|nr:endonuclease V [Candidatus Eisenbacteria bacterium]
MRFRSLHRWDLSYRRAIRLQEELAPRLVLRGGPRRPRLVAGADVSYDRGSDLFFAVVLLLDGATLEPVEESRAHGRSPFPYIPGLLSFREAPLLLDAFRKLKGTPDLVLFDGQGIAHPRGFGLASHVGLILDLPAVGCAKTLLIGEHDEPGPRRGDSAPLRHNGRTVGAALRTRDGVKPVYVSPGHRIGTARALEAVLRCGAGRRLPEPTRLAHHAVNRFRKERGTEPGDPRARNSRRNPNTAPNREEK